jgi:hypothetical protein
VVNLHDPPAGTIRASLRYPAFRWLLSGPSVSQTTTLHERSGLPGGPLSHRVPLNPDHPEPRAKVRDQSDRQLAAAPAKKR